MVKLPPSQSLLHTQVEEVRDQAACLLRERAQLAPPRGDLRRRLFLVRAPPYLGGPAGLASSGGSFYWAPRVALLACGGRFYPGPRAWWWRSLRRPAAAGAGVGGGGAGEGVRDASTVRCRMGQRRAAGLRGASTARSWSACSTAGWGASAVSLSVNDTAVRRARQAARRAALRA